MADRVADSHRCWAFVRRADWRAAARELVAGGVAAGARVLYVDDASEPERRAVLAGLQRSDLLLAEGTVQVLPPHALHAATGVPDPAAGVATVAARTREAVADGYAGLCMVTGVTSMVASAAPREAWARYEALLDRYARDAPLRILCGYDAWRLGAAATGELSCLHPVVHGEQPMFRLFAGDGDGGCVLEGEVDASCVEEFRSALRRALPPGSEVAIDASGLGFVDHRGLLALEHQARDSGRRVVLTTRSRTVARVASLLELEAVDVRLRH